MNKEPSCGSSRQTRERKKGEEKDRERNPKLCNSRRRKKTGPRDVVEPGGKAAKTEGRGKRDGMLTWGGMLARTEGAIKPSLGHQRVRRKHNVGEDSGKKRKDNVRPARGETSVRSRGPIESQRASRENVGPLGESKRHNHCRHK